MDDSQAIRQIAAAEDEGAVFAVARAFFRTQGFAALSYARPSRTDPGRSEVTSFGFPEGFVASYRERLAEYDPLPGLAARAGRPLRLVDVAEGRLTGNQQLFIDAAREHGLTDGFLLPTAASIGEYRGRPVPLLRTLTHRNVSAALGLLDGIQPHERQTQSARARRMRIGLCVPHPRRSDAPAAGSTCRSSPTS